MQTINTNVADRAANPDIQQELASMPTEVGEVNNPTTSWTRWHSLSLVLIVGLLVMMESFMPASARLWMWFGIMALLTLFGIIAGNGVTGLWLGLLIDTRNKVSLARFQMILWMILILSVYLTAVMVNV